MDDRAAFDKLQRAFFRVQRLEDGSLVYAPEVGEVADLEREVVEWALAAEDGELGDLPADVGDRIENLWRALESWNAAHTSG